MRRLRLALFRVSAIAGSTLAVAAVSLAAGCGPVESTSIQWQVEARLARADKLNAERLAPYEYTAAQRFLHKGKEEAGYAAFESAIDYFHKARLMAKQAEEKAEVSQKLETPKRFDPLRDTLREPAAPPAARPGPPASPGTRR